MGLYLVRGKKTSVESVHQQHYVGIAAVERDGSAGGASGRSTAGIVWKRKNVW